MQLTQFVPERTGTGLLYAQGDDVRVDVDPPLIEHDVVDESEADIRQTFVATVVDDQELDSVNLYYRFVGESSYSRFIMTQVSYSSTYIAQIPTDPNSYTAMEYYIQARDASGNRTVRGYTFSPLVRNIVPPVASSESVEAIVDSSSTEQETTGRQIPKSIYVVGGLLVLGLIASAASSSGGGSGGGDEQCDAGSCRLTVTLNPPF
ncbi:hypothetical protein [Granulosicoccus antarcticus]|nr:hypothetical protein [Granulosicoccus antarcticus]